MNERILNLLSLCMQAQEKGFNIVFDNAFNCTIIWHHSTIETGQEIIKSIYIIYRGLDRDKCFDEAEAYLKGLIA